MPQPSPRSEPAHAPAPLPQRLFRVIATRLVTPRMRRVTLGGSDLGGFTRWYAAYSALPEATRPWMRSYTLRAHDPAAGTVDIDGVDRQAVHFTGYWRRRLAQDDAPTTEDLRRHGNAWRPAERGVRRAGDGEPAGRGRPAGTAGSAGRSRRIRRRPESLPGRGRATPPREA